MTALPWTLRALRSALADQTITPSALADVAFSRSNQNPGHNTYLWQDPAYTHAEAARAETISRSEGGPFDDGRSPLWGLPISVKDCFDLAGTPTTCGTHLYRDLNGIAAHDSWLVEQLRALGAVIIGKSHLHPLAYGITGENPEYGDCLQPGKPDSLTGGSSSGAVASVLEGSAVAAIGTDTGGSVRVPAALGGLAGYRSTLGRGDWRGGTHLAESFDTIGWLFRDIEDAPLVAAPFAPAKTEPIGRFTRFAFVPDSFLHDCDPQIVDSYHGMIRELEALGLESHSIDTGWWADSVEIFAPIQAWEASRLHDPKHYHLFQTAIRERLEWGARHTPAEMAALRKRHAEFRDRMDELFAAYELLLMPSAPVLKISPGEGETQKNTRTRLLRYTSPCSLAGVPAVAIPCAHGGMQLAAARDRDESLLAFAGQIGAHRKTASRDSNS